MSVSDLWLTVNHLVDYTSDSLGRDQALEVWQSPNKPNVACDKRNYGLHNDGSGVGLALVAVVDLFLNENTPDGQRISIKEEDAELDQPHGQALSKLLFPPDLTGKLRRPLKFIKLSVLVAVAGDHFHA